MFAVFVLFRLNTLTLSACLILASFWSASAQPPLFHLRNEGSFSSYQTYEVMISLDGEVKVSFLKYGSENKPTLPAYETKLSEYEVSALLETIAATGFREARLAETQAGLTHGGLTSISVNCDGWSNTASFSRIESMAPLTSFAYRLVAQAEVMQAIETEGNPYSAMVAVSQRAAGAKVLQPYVLKKPLMAYIKTGTDRQRLSWAFEALAWLTTPEEYLGIVAAERRRPDRTEVLRYVGGGENVSEAHSKELCLLSMSFVQTNYRGFNKLSYEDKNKLEGSLSHLGSARYMDALPLLTEVFSICKKGGLLPQNIPLYEFKRDGLAVIEGFLQNGDAFLREAAIRQCEISARMHPKSGLSNPYSADEFERMRTLFKDNVLPSLIRMKASDPVSEIRQLAESAIAEIEAELKK
jgi:hypothetical protein